MALRIALMRSVQIAGQRVRMADARAMVEEVGGRDVRSVIATGNLLFRSEATPAALESALEAARARRWGKATAMIVLTPGRWRRLMAANPFPEESARAPARVLAWAMRAPLPDAGLDQLRRRAGPDERAERTAEGDLYCWFGGEGIGQSPMARGFDPGSLGTVGTNRNWNTMLKIDAALREMEANG